MYKTSVASATSVTLLQSWKWQEIPSINLITTIYFINH